MIERTRRAASLLAMAGALAACVTTRAVTPAPPPVQVSDRARSQESPLGLVRIPRKQFVLTRVDPLSLQPVGPRAHVGEYHYAWSFSPDCSEVALAISAPGRVSSPGRVGIRIIDIKKMVIRQDVTTGIAAEALGWILRGRLIAGLQDGQVVVVDPVSGEVLKRTPLPVVLGAHTNPHLAGATSSGLAMMLNSRDGQTPPYIAFADTTGALRTAPLENLIGAPEASVQVSRRRAGMAVDAAGERAFVIGADTTVAEVDLVTLRVRYHELPESLALVVRCPAGRRECSSTRSAAWLGKDRMAVSGQDWVEAGESVRIWPPIFVRPAGLAVVDTRTWTGWSVPGVSAVLSVDDQILAYGGALGPAEVAGVGLRAYGLDGRPAYHLFGSEPVWALELAGGYAYAKSDHALRVVAARSGEVVSELQPSEEPFYLLPACMPRPDGTVP